MAFRVEDGGWVKSWVDRGPAFGFNIGTPDGANAEGQAIASALAAPAPFAAANSQNFGNYANAFTGYMQGLAGLAGSQANNYGAYASGLGNLATAQANAQNNNQLLNTGYNSMAEAARQGALANLGSAALGAYGSASGSAMGAWGQNQAAYNKMLSDLGAANQTGLSQLGQSRNNALSNLGDAYSRGGIGLAVANSLPSMDFGGGGFEATGPEGEVASGSYGSSRAPRPLPPTQDGAQMFAGLDATRGDLNSTDIADRMDRNYGATLGMANEQHLTSRGMPSQMLGQTLAGLMALNERNVGASDRGMDQYYQNVTPITPNQKQPINVSDVLSGLTYGYRDSSDRLGGIQGQMGAGWGDVGSQLGQSNSALQGIFDSTIGHLEMFQTPEQKVQREGARMRAQRELDSESRINALRDKEREALVRAAGERALQERYGYSNNPFVGWTQRDGVRGTDDPAYLIDLYRKQIAAEEGQTPQWLLDRIASRPVSQGVRDADDRAAYRAGSRVLPTARAGQLGVL